MLCDGWFKSALLLFAVGTVVLLAKRRAVRPNLPTIGPQGYLGSWRTALRGTINQHELLQEVYKQYKGRAFMIPQLTGWRVMLAGPELINEMKNAPSNVISSEDAIRDIVQTPYTLGEEIAALPLHVDIARGPLTKNLASFFPHIIDEIEAALPVVIPDNEKDDEGWTSVLAFETSIQIIARTLHRIFVGVPLCREPGYLGIMIDFTKWVMITSTIVGFFPELLKPYVARIIGTSRRQTNAVLRYTREMLRERLESRDAKDHKFEEAPDDLVTWLIDIAPENELNPFSLSRRLLSVNFGAMHTTSMIFSHVLLFLAGKPEYIAPLRAEAETAVAEAGWTKEAMTRCVKLDSFIKESQRLTGLGSSSMTRRTREDYTFSDGTFVPAGTTISVAASSIHVDPSIYGENAHEFDGFRFSARAETDSGKINHSFITTSPEFLLFGHGKHACPGRYLAASIMKMTLASILLNYDVKLPEGYQPRVIWLGGNLIPDMSAKLLFRKRNDP
ncbi:cytochrome P450 [Sistotremastrum suecicum HHB10207 ss-3]|uniref:Cytochrome P450 n=1 Tax=Sistotremastrum suecicum HHB10207 ss-3 TaxID=1314776 RepID=A0A166DZ00_9AGAM|nr:cytochrome P450 [Sistotremastrum suecicum HHB10207 ss-3]